MVEKARQLMKENEPTDGKRPMAPPEQMVGLSKFFSLKFCTAENDRFCEDRIEHTIKTLSHDAIFLATCNAILLLGDVKLANTCFYHSLLSEFANIFNIPNICHKFTSLKSRIALQVARKFAPFDGALNYL